MISILIVAILGNILASFAATSSAEFDKDKNKNDCNSKRG